VLVNNLGDANYGLLTLVLALVGYFFAFGYQCHARFNPIYRRIRTALANPGKPNEVISFGLIIYLAIGLAGMALIYFTAPLLI